MAIATDKCTLITAFFFGLAGCPYCYGSNRKTNDTSGDRGISFFLFALVFTPSLFTPTIVIPVCVSKAALAIPTIIVTAISPITVPLNTLKTPQRSAFNCTRRRHGDNQVTRDGKTD